MDIARIPMNFSPLMMESLIPPTAKSTSQLSPLASHNLSPGSLIPPGGLIPPATKSATHSGSEKLSPLSPIPHNSLIPPKAKRTTYSSPLASEKPSPNAKATMMPRDEENEENDENNENLNFLEA